MELLNSFAYKISLIKKKTACIHNLIYGISELELELE